MLMSDTTFHLEESLTNLADIRTYRQQKEDPDAWAALDQAQREDVDSKLRQAESIAPFHTSSGRENIEWIRDITATAKEPFLAGEIVDRLAAVSVTFQVYLTASLWMRILQPWLAPRCRS